MELGLRYHKAGFHTQAEYAVGTPGSTDRWFPMETGTKYREFAAECERLAKQAKTERHRTVLLEMAAVWRELAAADGGAGKIRE